MPKKSQINEYSDNVHLKLYIDNILIYPYHIRNEFVYEATWQNSLGKNWYSL